jgi:hypothetical protein
MLSEMKPVKLPSIDRVKELVDYDKDSGQFTWKVYRGGKAKAGTLAGSVRADGYSAICIDLCSYKSSRLAWLLVTGEDPGEMDIDHINGDVADNRFFNLRLATESQNCCNRKKRSDNTSGFKGVYPMGKKWAAQIRANRKTKHLGVFETPELAHQAYINQANALHGEFARVA